MFNQNNKFFSYSVYNLNVVATCEYLKCYKIKTAILQSSNISKFNENYSQILFIFVALAWNGDQFVLRKGNNSNETNVKNV